MHGLPARSCALPFGARGRSSFRRADVDARAEHPFAERWQGVVEPDASGARGPDASGVRRPDASGARGVDGAGARFDGPRARGLAKPGRGAGPWGGSGFEPRANDAQCGSGFEPWADAAERGGCAGVEGSDGGNAAFGWGAGADHRAGEFGGRAERGRAELGGEGAGFGAGRASIVGAGLSGIVGTPEPGAGEPKCSAFSGAGAGAIAST